MDNINHKTTHYTTLSALLLIILTYVNKVFFSALFMTTSLQACSSLRVTNQVLSLHRSKKFRDFVVLVKKVCKNHLIDSSCPGACPKVTNFHEISFSKFNKICTHVPIFNKIFSGRQPSQSVEVLQRFKDWFLTHLQCACWRLGETRIIKCDSYLLLLVLTSHQQAHWTWVGDQSLKHWGTFSPRRSCLPEKILLISVAANASRLTTYQFLSKSNPNYAHTTWGTPCFSQRTWNNDLSTLAYLSGRNFE